MSAALAFYNSRGSASHARSIGITQRATPLESVWTGELRVRFSDFQVNEIRPDGSVVRLTCIGIKGEQEQTTDPAVSQESKETQGPKESTDSRPATENGTENGTPSEKPQDEKSESKEAKFEVSDADFEALKTAGGQKFAEELVDLYQSGQGDNSEKKKPVTSDPLEDKSKRGQVHQEVRRIFNSRIETTTDDAGAIIGTLVSIKKSKKRNRGGRNHHQEDKPTGEYLHFTLFKDNRDTMDAVHNISRILRVRPQAIGYAGTKDRRASTVQRCSVRYTRQKNLSGINNRIWGLSTGDYEYQDAPIHLGQLRGNEFTITIKDCHMVGESATASVSDRLEAMRSNAQMGLTHMAEHGWINYFGHQRFGTHEIGTHQIGKMILGEKYEEAVESLLSYDSDVAERAENGETADEVSQRDDLSRNQACMLFRTGKDVDKAMKVLPRRFSAEGSIMRHLNRQGAQSRRDFVGALIHITKGLRTMYLHAYQSYVWNHAVSKRWELHGEKVLKGDLIIDESDGTQTTTNQDQDNENDDIINPADEDDHSPIRARPLTEEEASSGRYTVYDLVLPTPGYDVIYPDNDMGRFYEEFMAREENGGLDPHKMRRIRREFSLPGRYRKIMNRFLAPPSIEFKTYTHETEQMHPTDLDNIRAAQKSASKRPRADSAAEPMAKKSKVEGEGEGQVDGDKEMKEPSQQAESVPETKEDAQPQPQADKIAAVVKFQLGSSAYATVTLRELMGDPPEDLAANAGPKA